MADLSQLSDDELLASLPRGVRSNNPLNLKDTGGRFRTFASPDEGMAAADANLSAYGSKHGINTVAGVVNRWAPPSDGNDPAAYAAHVAQRTGFKPDQRIDLADPNTRQQLLSAMSEYENGGKVVAGPDISKVSDADLLASLGQAPKAPQAPPVLSSHNGGVKISIEKPSIAQDARSGFLAPFDALASDVQGRMASLAARKPPTSLGDFGHQLAGDLASTPRMIGEALGLTSAPIQAAVRPLARALPDPSAPSRLSIKGGKVSVVGPRQLSGDEAQAAKEDMLNKALAAVKPVGDMPPRPQPMNLDQLHEARAAAYATVDASGHRFPNADVQALADNMGAQIRDMGGPKAAKLLSPSDAMHARLDALAKQKGGVPLTQLEKLRSDAYDVLVKPGGADAKIGGELRAQIDNLITASGNPEVAAAREANTRYMKVKDVTARADSADLRASSTYAGGNKANATRQNLRPLIDPKSPQQMRNLTPDERKALNTVVRGSPAANAARLTGKLLDPRGLLGATVQTALGIPTGGHSLLAAAPGMAASEVSNHLTLKSLQDLIDLMSMGGKRPSPMASPTAPPGSVSLLSPRGLIGAGVVAAPLARGPSAEGSSKTRRSAGSRAR